MGTKNLEDPQARLNRCLACVNCLSLGDGEFICKLDPEKSLLSEEFVPIAENLPLGCEDYEFILF